ncbi:hypothetical protein V493_00915 [Pseudogymnoascus sp. VKM F-4281 (FW-2241)]|nr:hypothetical protein V493_00915 [Pseudogymnoascus sp. VKM F-4281 (FW-2241)]
MRPEFRTWRVRYIPLDFNEQQLSDALQNHPNLWIPSKRVQGAEDLELDKCDANVIVKTLSTDIGSTHLVATVRFRHLPPPLLESGDPLSIEISTISANLPAGSKRKQESCQIIIDDHFFDLTVLTSPLDANHKVDILAISGLGSHAYGSYVHKLGGHMWLSDSLNKDCPFARVVIYGYNSKLQGSESFEDLDGLASSFQIALSRLTTSSKDKKPLVIIGHSLGGLVIKQSLIRIAVSDCEPNLLDSVVGAMFLGVPNDGMDIECLIPMVNDQPNRFLLESINRVNSQILRMQKLNFFKVLENSNIDLFCFYETLRSPTAAKDPSGKYRMTGEQRCLVSQSSASSCLPQGASSDHTIPLNCAHSDLVKFSLGDAEYAKVLHTLRELCHRVLQRIPRSQECISTLPDRRAQQVAEKPTDPNPATTLELRQSHLDSLEFPQIDGRLLNIKEAHAKTCQWLLSKSEYQDWLNIDKFSEHHGFLWIKGKPATGKSTIMKFAYTHAMNTMKDTIVISFFFNARGENLETSVLGMYRSLLVQILTKLPHLLYLFDSLGMMSPNNDDYGQWDIEIVEKLFGRAVDNLRRHSLTCFIDALDECEEDQVRDMVQFFESIGHRVDSSQIRFSVCFSSRHYPHITVEKSVQLTLEGQEGHEQDMANYLHSKLKAGRSKQVEQIQDEILERASGIFLWVVLVVKMLNTEFDRGRIHALRKRLDKIPNGLDELFSDILTRDSQNMEEMILCLQWILYAKRPLKREELYFAILAGVEPETVTSWDPEEVTTQDIERFVLSSSKGLADVTKSKDQTVQFIHESVRDFLLKGSGLNKLRTNLTSNFPGQSHERLKQCCETYMRIDTSEHLPLSLPHSTASKKATNLHRIASQKFPFLQYSVLNVLHHADTANGYGISQDVFVENFVLRDWINLDNYFERYQIRRHTSNGSLLYILAEQNLPNLIRVELKRVPHMDIKGERYGFPLLAALALKNESALRALLAPDISLSGSRDHQGAIRCVLENSGEINSQKDQSLLSWAAARGNSGLVTFLLATRKVDIDCQTNNKKTPLSRAAEEGHEAVVKMLLETGQVEVDSKNKYGQTPLSTAVGGGHEAVVKLLLETGQVEVNLKDSYSQTPLSRAAVVGHEAIVKLLLERDQVEVDSKDKYGQTPLSRAAGGGHEAVVKLLLETGQVEVDSKNSYSHTPLSKAAGGGHEAVVKLLLETGQVEVDSKDKYGQTPLSRAAGGGHEAVVKLLLETGQVEVDSKNSYSRTPLSKAAGGGHEAVVKLLLETGQVEVDSKDKYGQTPLSRAAVVGHEAVVKLLLETGQVEVDLKDDYGRTPLLWAAGGGHDAMVKMLLETGQVEVDSKDKYSHTPLSRAAGGGHEAVVKLLLETGQVEVDLKDDYGRTPLLWAAGGGHDAMVKMLLETGQVEVDSKDKYSHTPLSRAAGGGHEAVVKLLLETGQVEVDSTDSYSQTPLSKAAEAGHEAVAKLLLGHIIS